MTSIPYVGVLLKLVPPGFRPQVIHDRGLSSSQIDFLVDVYAFASVVAAVLQLARRWQ